MQLPLQNTSARPASVHRERSAGDEARLIAQHERNQMRALLRRAQPRYGRRDISPVLLGHHLRIYGTAVRTARKYL